VPIVLQTDLATAGNVSAVLVDGESQAYQTASPAMLRATVEHRNSRYRITAVVTGLAQQDTEQTLVISRPDSGGVIGIVDDLAKEIDARASPFSTHSDDALQAYTQAVTSADPQRRMKSLQRATELDPNFGLAYLSALDTASARDAGAVPVLLAQATAHEAHFTSLDRARFTAIRARLLRAPLAEQSSAAAVVLQYTPNSLDALVSLASLRFLQNDGQSGKQLMQKALLLSPGNLALRSYLAVGLVETRQFTDAGRVYSSLQNDPALLPQSAVCALLGGDTQKADALFNRFAALQRSAGDQALPIIQGNWLALSGRVPGAIALLKASQFSSADLRSLALGQTAVWELMEKQLPAAQADAQAALREPASPAVRALASASAAICTGLKSVDGLRTSVSAAPLREDQKAVVIAYGLFLGGNFGDAADAWARIVKQSGGTDLKARAMLAASKQRAGRVPSRGDLPVQPFMPNLTADDQFSAIAFDEMRRLLR
jgi:hypothetical protein